MVKTILMLGLIILLIIVVVMGLTILVKKIRQIIQPIRERVLQPIQLILAQAKEETGLTTFGLLKMGMVQGIHQVKMGMVQGLHQVKQMDKETVKQVIVQTLQHFKHMVKVVFKHVVKQVVKVVEIIRQKLKGVKW